MKYTLSILIFFFAFQSYTQQSYEWKEKETYAIDSSDIWTVDVLGNTYITKKEQINKYDSTGILKFSQSQKSIGRLSLLKPINTMKLVVFSEEQQILSFLDNTLTPYESYIELLDQNIGNATLFTTSSQPDKFWVYDQLNSKLHLLSLDETDQAQEIGNMNGILNSKQISEMIEQNNLLFMLDSTQGIFVLDMYGSLINLIKRAGIKSLQVDNEYIYLLENNQVSILSLDGVQKVKITCPLENVVDFRKTESYFYFRTTSEIKKYQLLFVE